ncbi:MAG: DUF4846 domain-containing protein [Ruminococcus sp.]|nr:DUF4846 domain-containing protein [Ruminococcus sp.]
MKKSPEGKRKKLLVIIAAVLIILLPLLIFVYIRTHPKWKAAELTIEAAERTVKMRGIDAGGDTLETRITTPEGYKRIPVEEGSFGAYLRNYPLLPDGIKLPVYDGTTIECEETAAVFDISLGDEGYQQCADSIIRLYSDYFYENGQYDKISFLLSNGDECDYERWRKGRRMFVLGDFSCELPAAFPDKSEKQYRNYLKEVMRYAGTLSLQKESEVIPADELRIGDIICNDTHVVMITDEAVNEKGEKCYLIGQSFIPAVCYHIVANVNGDEADPWFTQEQLEQDSFDVGPYRFKNKDIRRWKDGF